MNARRFTGKVCDLLHLSSCQEVAAPEVVVLAGGENRYGLSLALSSCLTWCWGHRPYRPVNMQAGQHCLLLCCGMTHCDCWRHSYYSPKLSPGDMYKQGKPMD